MWDFLSPPPSRSALIRAGVELRRGGVIGYPTEAVFGLGCDPWNEVAVRRLLALKQRPEHKGLILIASEFQQLRPFLAPMSVAIKRRVNAEWPGRVTWLLPARPGLPGWLRGGHRTIAVRVTAHPGAAALCRAYGGALVSTSANRSGAQPCRDARCVRRVFGADVDFILPGRVDPGGSPSRIIDAGTGVVVRA